MAQVKPGLCVDCGQDDQSLFVYGCKNRCRKCRNKQIMQWRKRNPESGRAAMRRYAKRHPERLTARRRAFYAKNGEKRAPDFHIKRAEWKKAHPEITRAHYLLSAAIRSGKIVRADHCCVCGRKCKPHGHHSDYSKPYEVTWLCASCHRFAHSKMKEAT